VTGFADALSEYQASPHSVSSLWSVMTEARNLVESWNDYSASLVERQAPAENLLGLRLLDSDPLAAYRDLDYPVLQGPLAVGSGDEEDDDDDDDDDDQRLNRRDLP
jgi:hypothetical protein